jgi:hypothetical protein
MTACPRPHLQGKSTCLLHKVVLVLAPIAALELQLTGQSLYDYTNNKEQEAINIYENKITQTGT